MDRFATNSVLDKILEGEDYLSDETVVVCGIITRITDKIVIITPFERGGNNMVAFRHLVSKKFQLKEGVLVKAKACPRRPKPSDIIDPPLFSHIAVGEVKQIKNPYPDWEQHNFAGTTEIVVTVQWKGDPSQEESIYSVINGVKKKCFVVQTDFKGLKVIIPLWRLESILRTEATLRFKSHIISDNCQSGVILRLLDSSNISVVSEDGTMTELEPSAHPDKNYDDGKLVLKPPPFPVPSSSTHEVVFETSQSRASNDRRSLSQANSRTSGQNGNDEAKHSVDVLVAQSCSAGDMVRQRTEVEKRSNSSQRDILESDCMSSNSNISNASSQRSNRAPYFRSDNPQVDMVLDCVCRLPANRHQLALEFLLALGYPVEDNLKEYQQAVIVGGLQNLSLSNDRPNCSNPECQRRIQADQDLTPLLSSVLQLIRKVVPEGPGHNDDMDEKTSFIFDYIQNFLQLEFPNFPQGEES